MDIIFSDYLRGAGFLFWNHLKHYSLALWGIRLRLDPDYPNETRFHGDLIVDAVLEYRLYGLFAPWCVFLAVVLPQVLLWTLVGIWGICAFRRAGYYRTAFAFWTRAYHEAPLKKRNQTRYAEEIMLEIERRTKSGADWNSPKIQELLTAGMRIQNLIVSGKTQ